MMAAAGMGGGTALMQPPGGGATEALFFFSSRRRHTRLQGDWSSDVCSSDLDGQISKRAHCAQLKLRSCGCPTTQTNLPPSHAGLKVVPPSQHLILSGPQVAEDRKSVV